MVRLDALVKDAVASRARLVQGGPLNKLQPWFLKDGRLEHRLRPSVVIFETAPVAGAFADVCYVLHDKDSGRRVAIDLIPDSVADFFFDRDRHRGILRGGDVDSLVLFRGKDVFHACEDCVCLLARLEPSFFSDVGYDQALTAASPAARHRELKQHGISTVVVTWLDDNGDERPYAIKVFRRVRHAPRLHDPLAGLT